jgi:hypothetical protein
LSILSIHFAETAKFPRNLPTVQPFEGETMTKTEAARRAHLENVLLSLGFTASEADSLRRISLTLRRWHERECGTDHGCIERDEATNKPYWVSEWGAQWGRGMRTRHPIADRETGARKRLAAILSRVNVERAEPLSTYVQTDPRGAALYILRPGDIPAGSKADKCYSRGICVY